MAFIGGAGAAAGFAAAGAAADLAARRSAARAAPAAFGGDAFIAFMALAMVMNTCHSIYLALDPKWLRSRVQMHTHIWCGYVGPSCAEVLSVCIRQ